MRTYRLEHLSDIELLRELRALVAQERVTTAALLAHIAEVDSRRLYLPAGFPSMYLYCVQELGLSEDAALKRIQAARAARRIPAIFVALAAGRLHLSGVVLLAAHLTSENAAGLLEASAGKSKAEIEALLARRFPRTELLALVQPLATSGAPEFRQPAPGQVGDEQAGASIDEHAPGHVHSPVERPRVKPLSGESFALQFSIGRSTHEKLRYAQALLSHGMPSGNIAQVFDRALDALIVKLEKRKFAATSKPRPRSRRSEASPRHIPAQVKRAVWARDLGRCTFVSATGHRCPSRKFLEYDHVEPVARGGQATVANLRLRCRGHNSLEAERAFGAGFMREKREAVRRAAPEAHARAPEQAGDAGARAAAEEHAKAEAQADDLRACLRELGFRAGEVRRAVDYCATISPATLEERVRAALQFLCPKARSDRPFGMSLGART